jgi:hypothetical protein
MKPTLAGVIALALLGAGNLSPARAAEASQTPPDDLLCDTQKEVAKFDGTNWVCAEAPRAFKYVFVTSEVFQGNLGGIFNGSDSAGLHTGPHGICNSLAGSAGLSGTYMAWIADDKNSPDTMFDRSEVPYMLADGKTKVADDYDDLVDCRGACLDHPIVQVETGRIYAGETRVWTNVAPNGTSAGKAATDSCSAWTGKQTISGITSGRTGQIGATADWTAGDTIACSNWRRLYCFEQ